MHAACERWMGAEGIRRGGKEPAEGTISRGFFFFGKGLGGRNSLELILQRQESN